MDAAHARSEDPRQLLLAWAWDHDLDEVERAAARACSALDGELAGEPSRVAWQAVVALGHAGHLAPLRKLRRVAMARLLARDLRSEISWTAADPVTCDNVNRAARALEELALPGRPQDLWRQVERASQSEGFDPGEVGMEWARLAGLGAPPWVDPGARAALALSSIDWEGGAEEDLRRAARAWALLERDELSACSGRGSGSSSGAKRL